MTAADPRRPGWARIADELGRHFALYAAVAATLAILIKIRHG